MTSDRDSKSLVFAHSCNGADEPGPDTLPAEFRQYVKFGEISLPINYFRHGEAHGLPGLGASATQIRLSFNASRRSVVGRNPMANFLREICLGKQRCTSQFDSWNVREMFLASQLDCDRVHGSGE